MSDKCNFLAPMKVCSHRNVGRFNLSSFFKNMYIKNFTAALAFVFVLTMRLLQGSYHDLLKCRTVPKLRSSQTINSQLIFIVIISYHPGFLFSFFITKIPLFFLFSAKFPFFSSKSFELRHLLYFELGFYRNTLFFLSEYESFRETRLQGKDCKYYKDCQRSYLHTVKIGNNF